MPCPYVNCAGCGAGPCCVACALRPAHELTHMHLPIAPVLVLEAFCALFAYAEIICCRVPYQFAFSQVLLAGSGSMSRVGKVCGLKTASYTGVLRW